MTRFLVYKALLATLVLAGITSGQVAPAASNSSNPKPPDAAKQRRTAVAYGKLPLSFEPNLGQTAKEVQWLARGPQYTLFIDGHDAVLEMNAISSPASPGVQPTITSSALRMNLLGAKLAARETGEDPQPGRANYFTGNDPAKWQRNVPMYGKVRLQGVYPGIDLVYYGQQGQLEYDFVVAPGCDPSLIRLNFDGAKAELAPNGDLVLPATGSGTEVRFHKPVVYQIKDGVRQPVDGGFQIAANRQVSFKLGAYNKSRELTIDPTLLFLGALGAGDGNSPTTAYGMTVDSPGEIILTGVTGDVTFPVTPGALQTTCNTISPIDRNLPYTRCANSQASSGFVSKISADGTSLVYSTYLHGLSGNEYGGAVAVDAAGDAYVLGSTSSNDFPVTADAFQSICEPYYPTQPGTLTPACDGFFNGGGTEYTVNSPTLFIAKLNPSGSELLYSTFFGGNQTVSPVGIALDSSNNIYFAGWTQLALDANNFYPANASSANTQFPVTASAYQESGVDSQVATLSKLSADGHTLLYSTFMGTALTSTSYVGNTQPLALAIGPNGIAYLAGQTNSLNFPTTTGTLVPTCPPTNPSNLNYEMCTAYNGFLSAFDTTKSGSASLVYSTFIGSAAPVPATSQTIVYGVAADNSNNAYITGYTAINNYPVTSGALQPTCPENGNYPVGTGPCQTGFFSKINPTGTAFVWSTYFGGTSSSSGWGQSIAFDGKGQVYLYGYDSNYGYDFPLVNPLEGRPGNGSSYAYVSTFSPDGTKLLFSTPLGNPSAAAANVYPIGNNGIALDAEGNIYFAAYSADNGTFATTPGTYATTATGPGNRSFFGKISPVALATSTTLTIAPTSAMVGQKATFTATVAGTTQSTPVPTGTVTLTNGNTTPATTIGTITLGSDGSGTFSTTSLAAGSYSVTASYSGDSTYDVSASSPETLTITSLPATTTTVTISPTGSLTYGETESLTATVAQTGGGTPTGSVVFTEGATTLGTVTLNSSGVATLSMMLPIGIGNIVASYGGSSSSAASASASLMVTVAKARLTVTAANASRVVGVANPTLTGTVSGTVNSDVLTATYTTTATISSPAGQYPIVPAITGANIGNYSVTLVNGTLTVTASTPTTTKLASSATSAVVGTSLTFTATVTGTSGTPAPAGTVTFKDGSTMLGTGTVNGSGVATYTTAALAAAVHSITASYSGDISNGASVSSIVSVTINAATPTTTVLTSSATSASLGTSLTFTATVAGTSGTPAPTGTVTFKDGTATLGIGTVNGSGVATYTTTTLATGTHSLSASYVGDTSNVGSVSAAVSVTVWPGPPNFTVILSPASGSTKAGADAVITITVTSVNGFSSATSLACSGLPKDSICAFSSTSVTPNIAGTATSTLTIQTDKEPVTPALESSTYRPTSASTAFARPISIAGFVAAFLLIPLLGSKNRKLRKLLLTMCSLMLLAILASTGISSCGGGPTTPKGTYMVNVSATAGAITQNATYTMTVQ